VQWLRRRLLQKEFQLTDALVLLDEALLQRQELL
jgi:hypothetical protein